MLTYAVTVSIDGLGEFSEKKSVAESNVDVRILTGSSEVAVSAHAQYRIWPIQPRTTGAMSGSLQFRCIAAIAPFLVVTTIAAIIY